MLVATYRIRTNQREAQARAQALAIEQSVEMPPEAIADAALRTTMTARVESLIRAPVEAQFSAPAHGAARPDEHWLARISFSPRSFDADPLQLLNVLFGNCALQTDVELLDASLPAAFTASMPGPRFGIEGFRKAIGPGAASRPLSCSALKPQGSEPAHLAQLAYVLARAGMDVIKDDHGIANQPVAPVAARVAAVQRAIERANAEKAQMDDPRLSGHRTLYAPHLLGGPRTLSQHLRVLRDEGVGAVLACPMLLGIGTFVELLRAEAGVPIVAHPAFANPRIDAALLLGRLFRLFGADATIYPNWGGRFNVSREACLQVATAAREPWHGLKPILPVPAGGMRVERCAELVAAYGPDTMFLIGGDLLAAGDALAHRAGRFIDALHAAAAVSEPAAAR